MKNRLFDRIRRFFGKNTTPAKAENADDRPLFETKDGYEICISCGIRTNIKVSTPIDQRLGYISGCGQLCRECYEKSQNSILYDYSKAQLSRMCDMSLQNKNNKK